MFRQGSPEIIRRVHQIRSVLLAEHGGRKDEYCSISPPMGLILYLDLVMSLRVEETLIYI